MIDGSRVALKINDILHMRKNYRDIGWIALYAFLLFAFDQVLDNLDLVKEGKMVIKSIGMSISFYTMIRALLFVLISVLILIRMKKIVSRSYYRFFENNAAKTFIAVKLTDLFLYVVAGLILLDYLGVNTKSIGVFFGVIGVGIGLGIRGIVSSFFSGIVLLLEQSIKIDDLIELEDGSICSVKKIYARQTMVETKSGQSLFIPNDILISSRIKNWSHGSSNAKEKLIFSISCESNIDAAIKIIQEKIENGQMVLKTKEREVYISEIDGTTVKITAGFWIKDYLIYKKSTSSEILLSVIKEFSSNGIKFSDSIIHAPVKKKN